MSASSAWTVAWLASKRAFTSVYSRVDAVANTELTSLNSTRCFSCSSSLIFFSLPWSFPSRVDMWPLKISIHSLSLRLRSSSNSNFSVSVLTSSVSLALSFSKAISCRLKRRSSSCHAESLPLEASLNSTKLTSTFFKPSKPPGNPFEVGQSTPWFGDLTRSRLWKGRFHPPKNSEGCNKLSSIVSSSILEGNPKENPL